MADSVDKIAYSVSDSGYASIAEAAAADTALGHEGVMYLET